MLGELIPPTGGEILALLSFVTVFALTWWLILSRRARTESISEEEELPNPFEEIEDRPLELDSASTREYQVSFEKAMLLEIPHIDASRIEWGDSKSIDARCELSFEDEEHEVIRCEIDLKDQAGQHWKARSLIHGVNLAAPCFEAPGNRRLSSQLSQQERNSLESARSFGRIPALNDDRNFLKLCIADQTFDIYSRYLSISSYLVPNDHSNGAFSLAVSLIESRFGSIPEFTHSFSDNRFLFANDAEFDEEFEHWSIGASKPLEFELAS